MNATLSSAEVLVFLASSSWPFLLLLHGLFVFFNFLFVPLVFFFMFLALDGVQSRFFLTPCLDTLVHYPVLSEQLARLIGCRPSLYRILLTDGALWRALWWNSHQPCTYRLVRPSAATE